MKKYQSAFTCCLASIIASAVSLSLNANSISLNGKWELSFWVQPEIPVTSPQEMDLIKYVTIPSMVPGNVELDLLSAGIIKDPMIGNNVNSLRKYEGYQWCYSRSFTTPAMEKGQKLQLFFGGIDCLADIWLNGQKVGSSDNMLIEQKYDITRFLKENGVNELKVILRSVVLEAQKYVLGSIGTYWDLNTESQHIRKAPHMFGWNIMPRVVSAGLWRDVELRVLDAVRFENVNWLTYRVDVPNKSANMYADFQLKLPFEYYDKANFTISLKRNGKEVFSKTGLLLAHIMRIHVNMGNVDFWWPRGYGDAALYEAEIKIIDKDKNVLASDIRNIGIRTVKLDKTDLSTPEKPGKFCFIINGEQVFIKGTNWTPLDALHSRDASLLPAVLEMVKDLNCNMIRCWGGNVYEDTPFYDFCDKNGIMIWQDFAMGCTFYPQGSEFQKMIESEIKSIVLKLRTHPSIALWSGNNENDVAINWQLWDFHINPNFDEVSRKTIARVLYEFDPTRPYLPSSPYCSPKFSESGKDIDNLPEYHIWGNAVYYKAPFYTTYFNANFVSEIGYHGCPSRKSLEKMFDKDFVYPWVKGFEWNEQWLIKATIQHPELASEAIYRNDWML